MYRFIILLILSSISMPVFAERTVTTIQPYYIPYDTSQVYYGGNYILPKRYTKNSSIFSDINELEKYAMNRNFTKDSDLTRLERLETIAFGAVQEGDIHSRYNNARNVLLSRPKQNPRNSILKNISNYFNGQLTGFTPPINSSNTNIHPYSSGYERDYYSESISPWGRNFKTNHYGIGSGTGIRILD